MTTQTEFLQEHAPDGAGSASGGRLTRVGPRGVAAGLRQEIRCHASIEAVFHSVEARAQGSRANAEAYLQSDLFNKDVVVELKPLSKAAPEVRIYTAE